MPDVELIIKSLEYCLHREYCLNCKAGEETLRGAIALLKEQDKEINELKSFIRMGGNRIIPNEDIIKAFGLIEEVLDTLIEVGNGTTDEELHKSADKVFALRYFLKTVFRPHDLVFNKSDQKCWEEET